MGDTGEGGNRAPPRSACEVGNGLMFRTANNTIYSIYYFDDSSPYIFVKQMCQIGNTEGFFLVDNYMCAAS